MSEPTATGDDRLSGAGRRLVYFAAERTLLSWTRAALTLIALGFVVDRFALFLARLSPQAGVQVRSGGITAWVGAGLVIAGVVMNVLAGLRYLRFAVRYRRYGDADPGYGLSLALCFTALIAIVGAVIAGLLLTVTA